MSESQGPMVARKICWPKFDNVCLEGGCGYCNDFGEMKPLSEIEAKVRDTDLLWQAYMWGYARRFCNAEVEYAQ